MGNDTVSMTTGGSSIVKRYGIADALSELMESAVMADTNASQKAYDMIRMHAYGLTPAAYSTKANNNTPSSSNGIAYQTERAIDSINRHTVSMDMEVNSAEIDDQTAIENYEKENEGRLAMAQFTMRDSQGTMQEVSIPKITMMPLPLLHVTEATFDLDLSVNLVDTTDNISAEELEMVNAVMQYYRMYGISTVDQIINKIQEQMQRGLFGNRVPIMLGTSSQWRSSQWYGNQSKNYLTLDEQLNLMYKYKSSTNSQIGPGSAFKVSENGSESDKSTTNLKVNIKMKQAELPDGIKLLLQAAANSLQVAAKELSEE